MRRFARGLMFHRFRADPEPPEGQGALTSAEFEAVLLDAGVENILSPDEWLERLEAGALESDHVCVTFDDGLRSQIEHALPVLQRFDLRAFWFVYSSVFEGRPVKGELYAQAVGRLGGADAVMRALKVSAPGDLLSLLETRECAEYAAGMAEVAPFYTRADVEYRYLRNRTDRGTFEAAMDAILAERGVDLQQLAAQTWMREDDLAMLAGSGHHVGLHSYDHPYAMGELPRGEQQRQYELNRAHITRVTGREPDSMSHPLNSYNGDTLSVLRELGIRAGFRANTAAPAGGSVNCSALELAREDASNLVQAQAPRGRQAS